MMILAAGLSELGLQHDRRLRVAYDRATKMNFKTSIEFNRRS